jgi:hypothetical protein
LDLPADIAILLAPEDDAVRDQNLLAVGQCFASMRCTLARCSNGLARGNKIWGLSEILCLRPY